MGARESMKLCRELDTWHPNDWMNMSSRLFRKEERVSFQSEKRNIARRSNIMVKEKSLRKFVPAGGVFNKGVASSSAAEMSSDTLSPKATPSEEVSTSFPDKKPTCERSSISNAPNRGKKVRKKASRKSRKVGPTSPKPEPINTPDVLAGKTKKKKKKKKTVGPTQPGVTMKNKMVGPTQPEEIDIISNGEFYEASDSSSRTDSFSNSAKEKKKNSMSGWKQWDTDEEIAGLNVDEKSESETSIEGYGFSTENGVEVGSHRFFKYPRTAMVASRRHRYLEDSEDDDREQGDMSPRTNRRWSVRSALSSKSGISDLSAAPTIKSAKSIVSDLSYMSDVHLRPGEKQRLAFLTPYISDYMPRASWHSPHYKDYEEEPYDMHTGQRQPKGSRNSERRSFV